MRATERIIITSVYYMEKREAKCLKIITVKRMLASLLFDKLHMNSLIRHLYIINYNSM